MVDKINPGSEETVKASCVILPDGTIVFLQENRGAFRAAIRTWDESLTDEQRATHQNAHTFGGAVIIRMLKSDYENIPIRGRTITEEQQNFWRVWRLPPY